LKKRYKLSGIILSILLLTFTFISCGGNDKEQGAEEKTHFTVGIMAAHLPTVERMQEFLEPPYELEIMLFDGNNLPAIAVKDGNLDSSIQNHKPWIDTFNRQENADLVMVKPYFYHSIFGIYSTKCKSLDEIPQDSVIAIPGDATNIDRAMRVLQSAGVITLREKQGEFYSLLDITDNPKNITFPETDITTTVSMINDCAAIVAFSGRMFQAGLAPRDYLLYDDPEIYPIGLVVRPEDVDTPWVQAVVRAVQSAEYEESFNDYWQGTYVLMTEEPGYTYEE
jgi:D-methionine transport system substrate-binding protein